MFDIEVPHPLYDDYLPSWKLMRDAADGEESVKAEGRLYLPLTTSMTALKDDSVELAATYEAYKARAEFPEILAPTIRAALGIIHETAAKIELPPLLEPLREVASTDGVTLDAFHARITGELLTMGRYAILPSITPVGPRLAGYVAESVRSWSETDGVLDFAALDETRIVRDPLTNQWTERKFFRELALVDGRFQWREWNDISGQLAPGAFNAARAGGRNQGPLPEVPLVIVNTLELRGDPDDIPLFGLATIAKRLYQLDADYRQALHMTAQPTPWVNGFDNPSNAIEDGLAPTTIGSAMIWLLGPGAQAGYLEFDGAGIASISTAKREAREAAVQFGAQLFAQTVQGDESGTARKQRIQGQTATFKQVAFQSAAALERSLRHMATLVGADPETVTVEPNLDFMDVQLTPEEIRALVDGWTAGAYSYSTLFHNLREGKVIPADRDEDEELALIDAEDIEPAGLDPAQPAAEPEPGQATENATPPGA